MRTLLVAGERGGDGIGTAGNRGLDTFLVLAVAKLYQAVIVKTQPGDITLDRCIDQRLGARTELSTLGTMHKTFEFGFKIEIIIDRVVDLAL